MSRILYMSVFFIWFWLNLFICLIEDFSVVIDFFWCVKFFFWMMLLILLLILINVIFLLVLKVIDVCLGK